jgi:Big-like domain-containing protein
MKRFVNSRTLDFAAFLGRRHWGRSTTSPRRGALPFLLATALAGGLGAAIAYAASPHATAAVGTTQSTAAVGTTQTTIALRVAKHVRAGRRTTMTASLSVPTGTPAPPPPTGTVRFSDRGKPIGGCAAQKVSKLVATCSVTFVVAGKHPISASYGGDARYAPVTSARSTLAVAAIPIKGDITARTSWTFLFTPTYTRVLSLTVGGLYEGSDVLLACQGKGCPFRSQDFPVLRPKKCAPSVPALECPPNNFFLTRYFAGHRLTVGARLTILISHPSYIGKYYGFTVRARQKPAVTIACLAPDSTQPGLGCRPRPDQGIPG